MNQLLEESVEQRWIMANGVDLHTVLAGPTDGPPVILLHGFPEFWYGWRFQIPRLANAGYRVIAPDQRGYNKSDKPTSIDAYTVNRLSADVVGILDSLGYNQAQFIGHDWGAGVLWDILLRYPERVQRAVPINVPHPAVLEDFLTSRLNQLKRSWYMFFFQIPIVPEWTWSAANWRGLRWFMDTSNREDTFSQSDLQRYQEAWSRPGAFSGMLNWYRALLQHDVEDPPTQTVKPPTMLIWGMQDPYLHPEMAKSSIEWCENGHLERIEDATHWVQHEAPDQLNHLLENFLAK